MKRTIDKRLKREFEIREELAFLRDTRTHLGVEECLGDDEFELLNELDDVRDEDEFGIPRYGEQ